VTKVGFGIAAIGGYLPQLRLDRKVAAKELAWSGLPMPRSGFRCVSDWDEDPVTMAVEAARGLVLGLVSGLVAEPEPLQALRFASTSAYFTDRAQAGLLVDALALSPATRTSDLAGSRRAGTSALLDALLGHSSEVVVAAEKRQTQAGSTAQFAYGDGAAAVLVADDAAAHLIGHACITRDLVDRYASREHPTPYAYEERFVRDIAVPEMLVPAIRDACAAAGITPSQIAQAACVEPVGNCWKGVAKALQMAAPNHCEVLSNQAGDLGAAHPLFAFGLALAAAKPGDYVLLVGFGSGVDALVFQVTGAVDGAAEMLALLAEGESLRNFTRFLNLTGAIDLDWGMRAEFEQKAQATVLDRVGRDTIGFIGGRDSMGNVQFPKSPYPVNPAIHGMEQLEDVRLADEQATIISVTADRLNFSPDPPFDFGLVQFANGARVLMEMANRPADGFKVGDRVRMRLRIKSHNARLGFRTYFWKAAPIARPLLGDV
jgi:3-hydroxy-3-methylglutaryl CoA synthase